MLTTIPHVPPFRISVSQQKKKTKYRTKKREHTANLTVLLLLHSPAISLGFTTLGEIFAYVTIFNPTIEVVTFRLRGLKTVCWLLVGCLTSQQQVSVSQGRICSDNFTCCHTEIEVADPTFYLTQSQYTDTGPTGPSADRITPGAWQGSHWSANF